MNTRTFSFVWCQAFSRNTNSFAPMGCLSRYTAPALSTEMLAKSFFVSSVAVVAVGRFTLTLFKFTMLRLTSMKLARRKNMMSINGMISIRASDSDDCLGPSLTGMVHVYVTISGWPRIPPDSEGYGRVGRKRLPDHARDAWRIRPAIRHD